MTNGDNSKKSVTPTDAKIRMHVEEAEKALFRNEELLRHRMGRRQRTLITMGIVAAICYLVCVTLPVNVTMNAAQHSLAWYFEMIERNVSTYASWLGGAEAASTRFHLTQYVIVALVGMALSVSGAVYQGALRNALASPSTLGVQTGGALGGTIFILVFYKPEDDIVYMLDRARNATAFDLYGKSLFILAGCFVMVCSVLFVAKSMSRGGRLSSVGLILSGMVFGGAVGSILGLLQYHLLINNTEDARTYAIRYVLLGTFDNTFTPEHLALIGIPIGACLFVVMMLRKKLNLLAFGEDEARTMGIDVVLTRNLTVVIVTIMTAVVISFCGVIGFIGFMVPHVARRMVGPDFNYLLPASALLGSIIMMIIFCAGLTFGYTSMIGLMTSLVGGGIFMTILIYYRRRGHADWA